MAYSDSVLALSPVAYWRLGEPNTGISTLTETFTGSNNDPFDSNRWVLSVNDAQITNPNVSIQNNKLKFSGTNNNTGTYTNFNLFSRFSLVGDFDIQVDISDFSTDYIGYVMLHAGAKIGSWHSTGYPNNERGFTDLGANWVDTSQCDSTLRITRVGNTFTTYYDIGGGWVQLGTETLTATYYTPYLKIYLNSTFTNIPFNASFDNLTLTSGTIVPRCLSEVTNSGNYSGSPTLAATGLLSDGSDTAVTFDGVDDYATGSDSNFPSGTSARSITCLLKTTVTGASYTFFSYGTDASGDRITAFINSAGYVGLSISGAYALFSDVVVNDGVTHHVAIVLPASGTIDDIDIYVDGVLLTVSANVGGTTPYDTILGGEYRIGLSVDGNTYFAGTLDEVAIFNTALSSVQVSSLYDAALSPAPIVPNPVIIDYSSAIQYYSPIHYYRLGESPGATLAVDEINGNDGTIYGEPVLGTTGLVSGDSNTAYALDSTVGNIDFVKCPLPIGPTNSTGAVSFIVNNVNGLGNTFVAWPWSASIGYYLLIRSNANNVINIYAPQTTIGVGGAVTEDNVLTTGTHHVIVQSTGTEYEVYIDGVKKPLSNASGGTNNGAWVNRVSYDCFTIGAYQYTVSGTLYDASGMKGTIDEVAIYNSHFTQEEATILYNAYLGTYPTFGYVDTMLSLSPIAYWRLNETSGEALDSIGTSHLIAVNVAYSQAGLVATDNDTAMGINGSSSKLRKSISDFRSGDTSGSLSFLFKSSDVSVTQTIFASSDETSETERFVVYIQSGRVVMHTTTTSTHNSIRSTAGYISNNTAHHCVVTSDGSTWKIYIDGAEATTEIASGANTGNWFADVVNRDNITVGHERYNLLDRNFFNGTLDEVAVFSTTLTSNDATTLYSSSAGGGGGGASPTPVDKADYLAEVVALGGTTHYQLDETTGPTATDAISSNDGTYNGTFVYEKPDLFPAGGGPNSGTSVEFNGSDTYINVPYVPSLFNLSTGAISFLVKTTSSGTMPVVSLSASTATTSDSVRYSIYVSDKVYIEGGATAIPMIMGSSFSHSALNDGNPHHIVVVKESSGVPKIYIDGQESPGYSWSYSGELWFNNFYSSGDNVSIGARRFSTGFQSAYTGDIDEVSFFSTALTSSNVLDLYNASAAVDDISGAFSSTSSGIASDINGTSVQTITGAFSGNMGSVTASLDGADVFTGNFGAHLSDITSSLTGAVTEGFKAVTDPITAALTGTTTNPPGRFAFKTGGIIGGITGKTFNIEVVSNSVSQASNTFAIGYSAILITELIDQYCFSRGGYRSLDIVTESIVDSESVIGGIAFTDTISETISHQDVLVRLFSATLTESIAVSEIVDVINDLIITIREAISQVSTTSIAFTVYTLVTELLSQTDVLLNSPYITVQENITNSEIIDAYVNFILQVQESVTISLTNSPTIIINFTASENITDSESLTANSIVTELLSDNIYAVGALSIGSDNYTFVVNTKTMALSEYTNYNFNSISDGYAANSTGIYKLNDSASSEVVNSYIETGFMDFGSMSHKQVPYAYLGLTNSGDIILKTRTKKGGQQEERTYVLSLSTDSNDTRKVNLGKGVKSKLWQFELYTGGDMKLDDLRIVPLELKRRI